MADGDLQIRFAPDAEALAGMRRALGEWLACGGAPTDGAGELVLAVDEPTPTPSGPGRR